MVRGTYGPLSRMGQKYKAKIGTWLDGCVPFLRLGQEWELIILKSKCKRIIQYGG